MRSLDNLGNCFKYMFQKYDNLGNCFKYISESFHALSRVELSARMT